MKINPKAGMIGAVVAAAVSLLALLAGCYLLVLGLRSHGWAFALGASVIEVIYIETRWITGEDVWAERCLRRAAAGFRQWRESREERKYRRRQRAEIDAMRLAEVEARVKAITALHIEGRLAALEKAEELRTRQEWAELRDVWRVLVLDSNTPEEIRDSCRRWLARYPETLDFLARRLMNLGLLPDKERILDEDWEQRERHKWRVQ